ncbi:MAG: hypothetical protein V1847_00075 [Candidatus Diapherotrites archaeon]
MRTRITNKGITFSLDALFAFVLSLLSVFLLLSFAGSTVSVFSKTSQHSLLVSESLAWASQLIENRDEANPANGACMYLEAEHRIQSHWLDKALLEKIRPVQKSNLRLSALYIRNSSLRYFFREDGEKSCWSVERFVVVGVLKEKAILGGIFCEA